MSNSKWIGEGRHMSWLELMVDPEGGFYFDAPAKEAIAWAIKKIECYSYLDSGSPHSITTEEQQALEGLLVEEYTPRDTEQNAWILKAYRRGVSKKETAGV